MRMHAHSVWTFWVHGECYANLCSGRPLNIVHLDILEGRCSKSMWWISLIFWETNTHDIRCDIKKFWVLGDYWMTIFWETNTHDIRCVINPYLSTWWISCVDILEDQYSWYQMWYQNGEYLLIRDIFKICHT